MTNPLQRAIGIHKDITDEQSKQAGKAIGGAMEPKIQAFLDLLLSLVEKKEIDPRASESFLHREIYNRLPEEERDKIDLALMNLQHMLEDILEFRLSKLTPDSAPQLETMILQLLDMKERIEKKAGDVFKF